MCVISIPDDDGNINLKRKRVSKKKYHDVDETIGETMMGNDSSVDIMDGW